jgi:hypothetical protein
VRGAAQFAVGQLGEPALDEVDPRRDGGREVQVEPGMAQQPFLHRRGLVRGVVVADQVQALQPGAALAAITDTSTNTPTAPAFSGRMKLDQNVHKLTTKDRS